MKIFKTVFLMQCLLLCAGNIHAQESIKTAGGLATGINGSVSFSIGQIAYTTADGPGGSISQGFQQPYEIITSIGIDNPSVHLNLKAYPNPTIDILTLTAENSLNLQYQLLDAQGKLLQKSNISGETTNIDMKTLPQGGYLLKIHHNLQLIKAFTILKR